MATKFLNLDEIQPVVEKSVTIKGVSHDMAPVSLADLIKDIKLQNAMAEKYADDAQIPVLDMIDTVVGMITSAFPTITRADVEAMTVTQMNALRDFIVEANGPTDGELAATEKEAPETVSGNA